MSNNLSRSSPTYKMNLVWIAALVIKFKKEDAKYILIYLVILKFLNNYYLK